MIAPAGARYLTGSSWSLGEGVMGGVPGRTSRGSRLSPWPGLISAREDVDDEAEEDDRDQTQNSQNPSSGNGVPFFLRRNFPAGAGRCTW